MSKNNTSEDALYNQVVKVCEFINKKIDEGALVINSDGDLQTSKFQFNNIEEPIRHRTIHYEYKRINYFIVGDFDHVEPVQDILEYALEQLSKYKYIPKRDFHTVDITRFK